MHMHYTGFDWLITAELEEHFPEDGVPDDLNFQDIVEDTNSEGLTRHAFHDWR